MITKIHSPLLLRRVMRSWSTLDIRDDLSTCTLCKEPNCQSWLQLQETRRDHLARPDWVSLRSELSLFLCTASMLQSEDHHTSYTYLVTCHAFEHCSEPQDKRWTVENQLCIFWTQVFFSVYPFFQGIWPWVLNISHLQICYLHTSFLGGELHWGRLVSAVSFPDALCNKTVFLIQ